MYFSAIVAATMATLVSAGGPGGPAIIEFAAVGDACTPVAYACLTAPDRHLPGWVVCNAQNKFEFGGSCPPETVCKFDTDNKSPYCVPSDFTL